MSALIRRFAMLQVEMLFATFAWRRQSDGKINLLVKLER
jgi:hypothetical protein